MVLRLFPTWPPILKRLLKVVTFAPVFMVNCFSMVIYLDQLPVAVTQASIMYKCVITWRQMTLPPLLLLAWYSLLFCRMPLVQSNFQGSLKAHQLSIKNSFSSPDPQRERRNMQQLGLGQHHGKSHNVDATEGSESCHAAGSCNLHLTSLGPPPIPHTFFFFF